MTLDISRSTSSALERPSWPAVLARLLIAGLAFVVLYSGTNWLTSLRSDVGSYVFDWEVHTPFIPASIVPYWSIDIFFVIGFFVCTSKENLSVYFWRILVGNVVGAIGFLLFPLRFTFVRPQTSGVFGWMFDVLLGFDKPFNQAPSLHIILTLVIWAHFLQWCRSPLTRGLWHAWCLSIAVSILTTYQHHFIDLITGFWAGVVVLYFVPDLPWSSYGSRLSTRAWHIARFYGAGALICVALAFTFGGLWWWLLWPAFSLRCVYVAYMGEGVQVFQKWQGKHSFAARILLAPYRVGAYWAMRWNCRRLSPVTHIADNVHLAHWPFNQAALPHSYSVVDLCAEFNAPHLGTSVHSEPMLDLVAPTVVQLQRAVCALESACQRASDHVVVHCALGLSRSALTVAAWLVKSGRAHSAEQAVDFVRGARPQVRLSAAHTQVLQAFVLQK